MRTVHVVKTRLEKVWSSGMKMVKRRSSVPVMKVARNKLSIWIQEWNSRGWLEDKRMKKGWNTSRRAKMREELWEPATVKETVERENLKSAWCEIWRSGRRLFFNTSTSATWIVSMVIQREGENGGEGENLSKLSYL